MLLFKKRSVAKCLCAVIMLSLLFQTAAVPKTVAQAKTSGGKTTKAKKVKTKKKSKKKNKKKKSKKKKEQKPLTARQKTFRSAERQKVMRRFERELDRITKWWWSDERKLKTCFKWFGRCRYIHSSPSPSSESRYNGWDIRAANDMLIRKRGDCYNYACAFAFFARAIGYKVRVAVGTACSMTVGRNMHCWVEIDGKIYDPEREYCWHRSNSFYKMSYSNYYDYRAYFKV